MTELVMNSPKTRALKYIKEHWSWIPVTFVQEQLGVSSIGFEEFMLEMASEGLVELSLDRTKVRYIRKDYSTKARLVGELKSNWYPALILLSLLFALWSNTTIGIVAFISVLLIPPLWVIGLIAKNALKEQ
jgi:hypothetical protein